MDTKRCTEIMDHVIRDCNYVWHAYEQGSWAFNAGVPRDRNPHIEGHVNFSEWRRGWDEEHDQVAGGDDGDA